MPIAHAYPAHAAHRFQRGQGMTEYIIIVALIAVSAITVYSLFGQTIRAQTAGLAKEMSGQSAQEQIQAAKGAADRAAAEGNASKTLSTYNSQGAGGAN